MKYFIKIKSKYSRTIEVIEYKGTERGAKNIATRNIPFQGSAVLEKDRSGKFWIKKDGEEWEVRHR